MNTVLFVNAIIGFSENLFLVVFCPCHKSNLLMINNHRSFTFIEN